MQREAALEKAKRLKKKILCFVSEMQLCRHGFILWSLAFYLISQGESNFLAMVNFDLLLRQYYSFYFFLLYFYNGYISQKLIISFKGTKNLINVHSEYPFVYYLYFMIIIYYAFFMTYIKFIPPSQSICSLRFLMLI